MEKIIVILEKVIVLIPRHLAAITLLVSLVFNGICCMSPAYTSTFISICMYIMHTVLGIFLNTVRAHICMFNWRLGKLQTDIFCN